jgi:hypothetical protein
MGQGAQLRDPYEKSSQKKQGEKGADHQNGNLVIGHDSY